MIISALFVVASDADTSSVLRYSIVDGNTNELFNIDRLTGEISVRSRGGLRLDNMDTDKVTNSFPGSLVECLPLKVQVRVPYQIK